MLGVTKLAPGEGHVDLAERPEREPGPGQVALDVAGVGICGTDLHIWLGHYDAVPPVTLGHEVCGRVAGIGEGVDAGWLGARVAVETYYSTCGRCAYCRGGRPNMCAQRRSLGTHADGGMAPRLVLPAHNLHRVPDDVDDFAATLSEPLACVCHSLLDPPAVSAGDRVLVVGPGSIGLVAAQVARACGGDVTVRGTPRDGARLALAEQLGFATEDGRDGLHDVDAVIECSGAEGGIAHALGALRRGGTLVQMGLRGGPVTLPWDLICFHELRVTAGFASTPTSWRRAMGLLHAGEVAFPPLVTDVVGLRGWRDAFEATRAADGVKYVIDPRREAA
jgi:L-iditol 2-dehydrogenase